MCRRDATEMFAERLSLIEAGEADPIQFGPEIKIISNKGAESSKRENDGPGSTDKKRIVSSQTSMAEDVDEMDFMMLGRLRAQAMAAATGSRTGTGRGTGASVLARLEVNSDLLPNRQRLNTINNNNNNSDVFEVQNPMRRIPPRRRTVENNNDEEEDAVDDDDEHNHEDSDNEEIISRNNRNIDNNTHGRFQSPFTHNNHTQSNPDTFEYSNPLRRQQQQQRNVHSRSLTGNNNRNNMNNTLQNVSLVADLMDMGFTRNQVIKALQSASGDVELAADMLFSSSTDRTDHENHDSTEELSEQEEEDEEIHSRHYSSRHNPNVLRSAMDTSPNTHQQQQDTNFQYANPLERRGPRRGLWR